jgi:hypothetical protein
LTPARRGREPRAVSPASPLVCALRRRSSLLPFLALAGAVALPLAPLGCASSQGDPADAQTSDEDDLKNAEKNGSKSQQWIYNGPLPKLEATSVFASLKAHTVRITGLLPAGYTGTVPYYAEAEPQAGGRTRVTVVYPIATGKVDPSTGAAPAAPGKYSQIFAVAYTQTTVKAAWGGFPFMAYNGGRGIAFHGPITSAADLEMGDYQWHLYRGPVSHGCNRMEGEHIVEFAHLLGVDMSKPHTSSEQFTLKTTVTISTEFDSWNGMFVDVDYPAEAGVVRPTTNAKLFKTWDSNDLPRFVCAYQPGRALDANHCATAGENRRDPITGASLALADGDWIGDSCASSDACSFSAAGAAATCVTSTAGPGVCSIPCEGYCPDKAGAASTFCAPVGGAGRCLPKAGSSNDGCAALPGTAPVTVARLIGASAAKAAKATVCMPQ